MAERLKSEKIAGRHHDLIDRYDKLFGLQMTADIFSRSTSASFVYQLLLPQTGLTTSFEYRVT